MIRKIEKESIVTELGQLWSTLSELRVRAKHRPVLIEKIDHGFDRIARIYKHLGLKTLDV